MLIQIKGQLFRHCWYRRTKQLGMIFPLSNLFPNRQDSIFQVDRIISIIKYIHHDQLLYCPVKIINAFIIDCMFLSCSARVFNHVCQILVARLYNENVLTKNGKQNYGVSLKISSHQFPCVGASNGSVFTQIQN